MDKKTASIIAVIATTLLCGLPGLAGLCFGSLALLGGLMSNRPIPGEDTALVVGSSIMILGLSLVFIATPIGIGLWVWWSQKTEKTNMAQLLIPEDDF